MPTKGVLNLLANVRHKRILELLEENGNVSNADAAEALGVSLMTVRRDLAELEHQGLILRVHGGAQLANTSEVGYAARARQYPDQKRAIGELAAMMIQAGETIYLDAGSTTIEIARHLRRRKIEEVRVVTHAVNIATELAGLPHVQLVQIGGEVYRRSYSTAGAIALDTINRLRFNRMFLATQGFSLEAGVTDWSLAEVEVKRAAANNSAWVAVTADASKWGKVLLAQTAPISSFHAVITDSRVPDLAQNELRKMGLEVWIAGDTQLTPKPPPRIIQ